MCKMHNKRLVQMKCCIFRTSIIMEIIIYPSWIYIASMNFTIFTSLAPKESTTVHLHTVSHTSQSKLSVFAQSGTNSANSRYRQKGLCEDQRIKWRGVTWHLSASHSPDNATESSWSSGIPQKHPFQYFVYVFIILKKKKKCILNTK